MKKIHILLSLLPWHTSFYIVLKWYINIIVPCSQGDRPLVSKRLSFQYRTKNEDKLIAYIAVSQDRPNIDVPNVENQLNGCRILGVYTENYQIGHYQVTDLQLLGALLDEAEFYIKGWVNNQNGQFQFDYLWFNVVDFDSQDVVERIDNMILNNGIAYKLIKRNE